MKKILLLIVLLISIGQVNALIEIDDHSKFIAAVIQVDGQIEVWINTREHWENEGNLIDSYSEQEAQDVSVITEWTNLCSLAESSYEPCKAGRTIDRIKRDLLRAGVMIEQDFQSWAEAESADY